MKRDGARPEEEARVKIDSMLELAGWVVQSLDRIDLGVALGVAVREYYTDSGPADYILFVDREPVGVIEAKKEDDGYKIKQVEEQAEGYAKAKLRYINDAELRFVYESTGEITRFTDLHDPKPRSREVFSFHRPETFAQFHREDKTLRARLQGFPPLLTDGLRDAQIKAISNIEKSFTENRPRALVHMATGAGKTFTACTFAYRLLRHANARRILFLVDTRNLGKQAMEEFMKYQPRDDKRKFTELYNVQLLQSHYIASDSQICISTIQRLYSILKGEESTEVDDLTNPNEKDVLSKEPVPVAYSPNVPIETFDFIIIDECHRSIYNLWQQVLDYFDAFLIGLTATPDKRTFGFFRENVVSEYTYQQSIIDGVNVPFDVFRIKTKITEEGAQIEAKRLVDKRDKLTRKERWEQLDSDYSYAGKQLDKSVVNPSQIRHVIKAFKESLYRIFPERYDENGEFEVPKTLIFAKTDSHASDIIEVVREEFAESNDFCKKITYKIEEKPETVLNNFRNSWNPRIAVTVDMIATGTDVKPLEVLLFMRDVKSINYYAQMKGRGVRTIDIDSLRAVTRTAKTTKTRFVLIDAVGVEETLKTDERPLEQKPSVSTSELLKAVSLGSKDKAVFDSLADRLIRIDRTLSDQDRQGLLEITGGKDIKHITEDLLRAYDEDEINKRTEKLIEAVPQKERTEQKKEQLRKTVEKELIHQAQQPFTGRFVEYIDRVRREFEQIIDKHNIDEITGAEWARFTEAKAEQLIKDFEDFIEENRDEITALKLFYAEPYQRRELTFKMIEELYSKLTSYNNEFEAGYLWDAYKLIEKVPDNSPREKLTALVSLVRRAVGLDGTLTPYGKTVDKNFQNWAFQEQAGHVKFTEAQMEWLRLMKDHIKTSFHIGLDDLDYTPFDRLGGRGRMYQLFGDQMQSILNRLNEAMVAQQTEAA